MCIRDRYRNVCAHGERLFTYRTVDAIADTPLHKKLSLPQSGNPVSYTHLDVYKRQRQSSFEPQILPKRQKDISSIDDKIISMYAKGMTCLLYTSPPKESVWRQEMLPLVFYNFHLNCLLRFVLILCKVGSFVYTPFL